MIKKILAKLSGLHVTPGHYYSPIVNRKEIAKNEAFIWRMPEKISEIELYPEDQFKKLKAFLPYYKEMPYENEKIEGWRYRLNNPMFGTADGIILYSMLRNKQPARIIEVGSGFSSAIMLDVAEHYNLKIHLTFIEPFADRLKSLLKPADQVSIIEKPVQDVSLETFDMLEAGDLLFIDSTHVSKTGSDVNFILFEILPRLKSGVMVHFHDIFYPFEYPKRWILEMGRSWNESYILRAYLSNNNRTKIIFWFSYLEFAHRPWIETNMPLALSNPGGSIWLQIQ